MTPLKSIRKFCVECVGSSQEIKDCKGDKLVNFETGEFTEMCNLFEYRFGVRPEKARWTPLKAIRKECLFCMCGSYKEVKLCPSVNCFLYPYRFGHNPNRKGIGGNMKNQGTDVNSNAEK